MAWSKQGRHNFFTLVHSMFSKLCGIYGNLYVCTCYCYHTTKNVSNDTNIFHSNYYCPLCCQSFCDLGALWKEIDNEIANVPMPEEYQNTKIWILCRDCHQVAINFCDFLPFFNSCFVIIDVVVVESAWSVGSLNVQSIAGD